MLLALSCRHCGSRYVQIERPVLDYQDHRPFPTADTCHCADCDRRWTLTIPLSSEEQ